jgi:GxxExxY protein
MNIDDINHRSGMVVDAAIRVHSKLGPGLLESAYEACLMHELGRRHLRVRCQVPLPVTYEGVQIELGYRLDLVVEDVILVELKAVTRIVPLHEAQLMSYLKLGGFPVGLLINFNVIHLKDGIRRIVNDL